MVVVVSYHVPVELDCWILASQTCLSLHGYYYCSSQFQYYDTQPWKLADCSGSICVKFHHMPKPIAQNTVSAVINWPNILIAKNCELDKGVYDLKLVVQYEVEISVNM